MELLFNDEVLVHGARDISAARIVLRWDKRRRRGMHDAGNTGEGKLAGIVGILILIERTSIQMEPQLILEL